MGNSHSDSVYSLRFVSAKFGPGVTEEIGYYARELGGKEALLVTDKGIVKAGLLEHIKRPLEALGIETNIWDDVEPEPSFESMQKAVDYASNLNIDIFVGFGGGSSIDTAKVANLITTHKGDILDYVAPPTGKGRKVPGPCKPLIAVPTTAGTGSEASPAAIFSLPDQLLKFGFSFDLIKPSLAILDPLMTTTMPPNVTASTGMDALSHAIEAYVTWDYDSKPRPKTPTDRPIYEGATIFTDLLTTKSMELIQRSLRTAVYSGNNIEARSDMLLASFFAGVAFTNAGLGAVHAASFPVGAKYHAPHGLVCAILLPAVMKHNLPSNYRKYAEIARILGEDVGKQSIRKVAESSVECVKKLMEDIAIPIGLVDIGAEERDIPELARESMKVQRLLKGNPRPVTQRDMEKILTNALRN